MRIVRQALVCQDSLDKLSDKVSHFVLSKYIVAIWNLITREADYEKMDLSYRCSVCFTYRRLAYLHISHPARWPIWLG